MVSSEASDWFQQEAREYSAGNERPMGGYVRLMATYAAGVAGLSALVAATRRPLPDRPDLRDIGLLALATAKASRLATRDAVTSPIRMPFTRFDGPGGPGEVNEDVRGHGMEHSLGEMLTCPFCAGQWIATGFSFGLLFAPKVTRQVVATFAALELADMLQFGRAIAEHRAEQ